MLTMLAAVAGMELRRPEGTCVEEHECQDSRCPPVHARNPFDNYQGLNPASSRYPLHRDLRRRITHNGPQYGPQQPPHA